MFIFPVQLTTRRIGNLPRLILLLLYVVTIHLTYSIIDRPHSILLWSLRTFPSLPDSRLMIFPRVASSVLLQLVNHWLNFTYSRSHAFRHGRKDTNSGDKNRTHDSRTSRCADYLLLIDHSGDDSVLIISTVPYHGYVISNSQQGSHPWSFSQP